VNSIIVHKFDFSDEEVMAYYISFLKTLSLKLNAHTIHFFYNEVNEVHITIFVSVFLVVIICCNSLISKLLGNAFILCKCCICISVCCDYNPLCITDKIVTNSFLSPAYQRFSAVHRGN